MKKSTIEYYREVVRKAARASEEIGAAKRIYEERSAMMKYSLEEGDIGQKGYDEGISNLKAERDSRINDNLSTVLKIVEEYDAEMDELGQLDGSRIDSGTMAILNSGLKLSSKDWQELANRHKDDALMSRILREKYDANRPEEKEPVIVKFGQSPESRKEVFSKFVRTAYNACQIGALPATASGKFNTVTDYLNYIARDSIENMQPYGDETFDNVDKDFPVEVQRPAGAASFSGSESSNMQIF